MVQLHWREGLRCVMAVHGLESVENCITVLESHAVSVGS